MALSNSKTNVEPLLSIDDEEQARLKLFRPSEQPVNPLSPISESRKMEILEVEPGQMSPNAGTLLGDARSPLEAYCENCKKYIITVPTFHTGRNTHFMGALMCLLGFYCCCCCLPYHMKDCKDVRHICPYCDVVIKVEKFLIL